MSYKYAFAYEDRDELMTSRWSIDGISTLASGGNLLDGRLFVTFALDERYVAVSVYKDSELGVDDLVMSGSVSIDTIDTAPVKCTLSDETESGSGLSGSFYLHSYTSDPSGYVELLVALCDDVAISEEYENYDDLPGFDSTAGMAQYCLAASQKVLLHVSQLYKEALGGYGAPEDHYNTGALRTYPRFDRIASPDQLREAAVHWALMLAFGACHERAQDTMYSELRDYHDAKRAEAIAGWNLAINSDPDTDADSDESQSAGMVRMERI